MQGAWPVAEVRAAEARLMARSPAGTLMARAAAAVAVAASSRLGFCYGARVLLLVGPGDNGGDALYAGALLAGRGVAVRAALAVPDRVHAGGLAAFRRAGGLVVDLAECGGAAPGSSDLVIDGLLGIGARGPVREPLLPFVELANSADAPVLAVDVPSGVDPDTGEVANAAVRAELTLCMGAFKPGLLVGAGRLHAGEVRLVDIGLGPELPEPAVRRLEPADVAAALPRPGPADDKYSRGVVGVATGSDAYPGAALLSVGAARLGGVGAVRYAGRAAAEVVRRWPETLVTADVAGAGRVQCWTVGSGLGGGDQASSAVGAVLASDVPVVVDADGLNLLAENRSLRESMLIGRAAPTVLTPHDREFARLFGGTGGVGSDRLAAARRAADESGATVLLKGFATIVASPGGRCFVNPLGPPALATAGSGDVLAGLIGSLLAAGVGPALGAAVGAYLHGMAGQRAAADGPVSAGDLLPALRAVIAEAR